MKILLAFIALASLGCVSRQLQDVDPLRIYEVRMIVAAEDEINAAEIICGPYYREIVCETKEVKE